MERQSELPSFENPPVLEAVIGVEFSPTADLGAVNLSRLAHKLEGEYPTTEDHIAIAGSNGIELFLPNAPAQTPALRIWMISEDERLLVQAQYDRLVVNWRKVDDEAVYPRFDYLLARFLKAWSAVGDLADEGKIHAVVPVMAEVSYVNRVPLVSGVTASSIIKIFDSGSAHNPDALTFGFDYGVTDGSGPDSSSGRVAIQGDKIVDETGAHLRFVVTSRSPVIGDDVETAVNFAHKAAVLAFAENTSTSMHDQWGKMQ